MQGQTLTLLEIVRAVSELTIDDREVTAVVMRILRRGVVRRATPG